MNKLFILILLYAFTCNCSAQELQAVPGLPTKEIYDLKIDHKGYLWVAHDLGISRFDGVNFTHYSNELQSSLSMTDLVEDNEGRIWCHNFNSQVFYVEGQKMKLFTGYDYKNEREFPRMGLCGNELLITGGNGIYAVETKTMQTRFYPFENVSNKFVSISIIGNQAIIYDRQFWYVYEHKKGLRRILSDPKIQIYPTNVMSLQPGSMQDTIFLTSNPLGLLQKLIFKNDQIKLLSKNQKMILLTQ